MAIPSSTSGISSTVSLADFQRIALGATTEDQKIILHQEGNAVSLRQEPLGSFGGHEIAQVDNNHRTYDALVSALTAEYGEDIANLALAEFNRGDNVRGDLLNIILDSASYESRQATPVAMSPVAIASGGSIPLPRNRVAAAAAMRRLRGLEGPNSDT